MCPVLPDRQYPLLAPKNHKTSPGEPPSIFSVFFKTCSISANYKPFSTKFSEISAPMRWQRLGKKMLKNVTPSWGCPTPHILKYCQLLDISGNYERISMKFSGISLLARRREMGEKIPKYVTPSWGGPGSPNPPILKHALSRPITNRFLLNFQDSVSQLDGKE